MIARLHTLYGKVFEKGFKVLWPVIPIHEDDMGLESRLLVCKWIPKQFNNHTRANCLIITCMRQFGVDLAQSAAVRSPSHMEILTNQATNQRGFSGSCVSSKPDRHTTLLPSRLHCIFKQCQNRGRRETSGNIRGLLPILTNKSLGIGCCAPVITQ